MIIYKKFPAQDQEAFTILQEIQNFLKIDCSRVEIYHVYQFKDQAHRAEIIQHLFDPRYGELLDYLPKDLLFIKDKDGQYNQVQDQTLRYLKAFLGLETDLRYFKGYRFDLAKPADLQTIKAYLINDLVQEETTPEAIHFDYEISDESQHESVEGFKDWSTAELLSFKQERGVGLDVDDLQVIQSHFQQEGRDPRFCEIKILDTYWSDHCRHTTFLTNLQNINIQPGKYQEPIQKSYQSYLQSRAYVYEGKQAKPISLMDLATINAKELKKKGLVNDLEDSTEINACSVELDIEVNGETQTWLHMFKNETHNHPTEIEPYGGAHTCIGGCIRDPLSGRAEVIQGIRIVGSANPLSPFENTLEGKLPQRYIATRAMQGFSDYANQIGAPVGIVKEYYDEGFLAKRMELGALVAAVPKAQVRREEAVPGDIILLLGAPTGRDGLGAAVGSSSVQTKKSVTKAGAEVQRGNPFAERKIIRLFKNPEVSKLIKKCNDFGAGGVSVAIGELADGLDIDLNAVHTKYPGLNGYEIALSESQERMAVVIAPDDLPAFIQLCEAEDLPYAQVAQVTDSQRMRMHWHGKTIVDLSRDLLNSNGATKQADVTVNSEHQSLEDQATLRELNRSLGKTLSQHFDSTLGRNAVLAEYGGKLGLSAQDGIVTRFPSEGTHTASVMTYAYFPRFARQCAYHGGYYAVLQSLVKTIALTGKFQDVRLSLQEFFPSIKDDPERMGLPFMALLGAFEVMKNLNIPAIGGKDSMSGSWHGIDVPPTLVSFAVNTVDSRKVVSREFKQAGSKILITRINHDEHGLIDFEQFHRVMAAFAELHADGKVLAASAVSEHGIRFTLEDMALGNGLIANLKSETGDGFSPANILFEVDADLAIDPALFEEIGSTTEMPDPQALVSPRNEAYETLYGDILESQATTVAPFEERALEPLQLSNKNVLIPVLDGATGEYDLQRAFEAAGFTVSQEIIHTRDHQAWQTSIERLADKISEVGIFALPHGDYFGSAIKNAAGALRAVLEDERIVKSLEALKARQGFILGIGAGMAALVDAGYFGDIKDDFYFTANKLDKYTHFMQDVSITKNSYLSKASHTIYTAPVSGRQMTIHCHDLARLSQKVDIIAMNTISHLPSDCGVDSIASKCGHVFGTRTLIDRMRPGLYQNIAISALPKHFEVLAESFC
jgi:phosphoribosylformylglycinamidine synthase